MRFFENGPNIPSDLLEKHASGNVVFFCGAGISRKAGLPDFWGLTQEIIKNLNSKKAYEEFEAKESFDRIFNTLIEEFGTYEIDRSIYEALKSPKKAFLDHHKTIIDLAKNRFGTPQIVTTNFDLLFEQAHPRLKTFVPPSLPSLSLGDPIQGVIYLHGRLKKADNRQKAGYIISSTDFGRAYLAQGWATQFVKELREKYTILLIGYSANDPPMRYLLEGLHDEGSSKYKSPIYTFTPNETGEAQNRWKSRGIVPISYDPIDRDHSGLWNTLSTWANFYSHPNQWLSYISTLAACDPSTLSPHQRGQVAYLVSSRQGAKTFSTLVPAPPAQWLCVFDSNVRYAEPKKELFLEDGREIDPQNLFGLDDDSPRSVKQEKGKKNNFAINYLNWLPGDEDFSKNLGMTNQSEEMSRLLPERISYICNWFLKISHEPVAIWWICGLKSVNYSLIISVIYRIKISSDFPSKAKNFWNLFLESKNTEPKNSNEYIWFDFKDKVKSEGWSDSTFRELERLTTPKVFFGHRSYKANVPPSKKWDDLELNQFLEIDVRVFDTFNESQYIPEIHLYKVICILKRNLDLTSQYLSEIKNNFWQTPTLYPDGGGRGDYHGKKTKLWFWFFNLLKELKKFDLSLLKYSILSWNKEDDYFFGKLYIYFMGDCDLFTSHEIAEGIHSVSKKVFFNIYNRRELLFSLKKAWPYFNIGERQMLEQKIISGGDLDYEVEISESERWRASTAASMLGWLALNDCQLTKETAEKLSDLKKANPRWNETWATTAADSYGPRGGIVETIITSKGLEELPISEIVPTAIRLTVDQYEELRKYRPFSGLVNSHSKKALLALIYEARQQYYPKELWISLLSQWPGNAQPQVSLLLFQIISKIPLINFIEISYHVSDWIQKFFAVLYQKNKERSIFFLNITLVKICSAETSKGNDAKAFRGSIDQPISKIAICLFHLKEGQSKKLPDFVKDFFCNFVNMPDEAARQALFIIAQNTGWLDFNFKEWFRSNFIFLFDIKNKFSDAMWQGLSYNPRLSHETWLAISSSLCDLLLGNGLTHIPQEGFYNYLRISVSLTRRWGTKPAVIDFAKMREILISISNDARVQVINELAIILKKHEGWSTFIKPFVEKAWPKQIAFKTKEVTKAFVHLACNSPSNFKEKIKAIIPFIEPIDDVEFLHYRFLNEIDIDGNNLAKKFPRETLRLIDALIPFGHQSIIPNLGKVLETISEEIPDIRQERNWQRLRQIA